MAGKKLSVPRSMAEIQRAYQELCVKAGQLQYQVKVYGDELSKTNTELLAINNEAAARKQLDDQAAPKTEETSNV